MFSRATKQRPQINQWQSPRSDFNHDWLKNQFLNALDTFVKRLVSGRISGQELEEFRDEDFACWERRRADAEKLANTFAEAMSPKNLFQEPPLCRAYGETKAWLAPLVHELWMTRCSVDHRVGELRRLVAAVDAAYGRCRQAFEEVENVNRPKNLVGRVGDFEDLLQCCRALSKCLSKFPRKIEVV